MPIPGDLFHSQKAVEKARDEHMATGSSRPAQVTFLALEKQDEDVTPKKLGKLTVKYNRKELQRRIKLEEWIDAQIQELYQSQEDLRDEAAEPEIDIDDLLDLSCEEQKSRLQDILQECPRPAEEFTMELLERLKGLRKLSDLQHK
ncbi:protein phosphatase 1 regulatory subunit 14D [Bufo bufo]|uniref:protein phosphatase 1 regulatory subunit 14D n=1 Tax=Bufo bufo TaxID=8384 RepID=UPI001ABEC8BE|nr:protein phosphatase 1 regulatory subunit 14D [Bufo bufo]